jgi:predicted aspartyl protease
MKQGQRQLRRSVLLYLILIVCFVLPVFAQSSKQSNDPKKLIRQSDRLIKSGKINAAEELLRRAVTLDATSESKLALSHALSKKRLLKEASVLSYEVAHAEPNNARAFAVLGNVLLNGGRFEDARLLLVNALTLNQKEDLAWAALGMLDFYENRISEGLANLREAVSLNSDEPDYLFALGQVSARAELYRDAADAYNRFLQVSTDDDDDRRERIRGLITFLRYLGERDKLYFSAGAEQTKVKFELIGNRPIIEVGVNGRKERLRFVLDTGSGITVISKKTAKRIGVNSITKGGFAKGIGGDGKFEIVYGFINQVSIGDAVVKNVPVYIRDFQDVGYHLDGYIGLSLISKFLTTIDYGEKTFLLTRRLDDAAAFQSGSELSLPLRLTSSGFLSGEVQLEGIDNPLNFIVDTGASVSVISQRVASTDAISRHLSNEKHRVIGAAGVTENVPSFMLPRVTFGKHSRKSISAIALNLDLINEASGFEQAGILGGNFLKNYKLTFDFKNSKVTFVPIGSEN